MGFTFPKFLILLPHPRSPSESPSHRTSQSPLSSLSSGCQIPAQPAHQSTPEDPTISSQVPLTPPGPSLKVCCLSGSLYSTPTKWQLPNPPRPAPLPHANHPPPPAWHQPPPTHFCPHPTHPTRSLTQARLHEASDRRPSQTRRRDTAWAELPSAHSPPASAHACHRPEALHARRRRCPADLPSGGLLRSARC